MERKGQLAAAIFDLDGVITDTARIHALAWKELIDGFMQPRAGSQDREFVPFDVETDYRRWVDGKPRYEGLASFLESRGIELPWGDPDDPPDRETVCGLANGKDALFLELLEEEGVEVFPGAVELVRGLAARGVRTGVASSSRNCRLILERAGLTELFEARVDGETLAELGLQGKPDPDMFLEAARRLGAPPDECIVFEDAVAGVEAGRRGSFGLVVGVALDRDTRSDLRAAGADLLVEVRALGELTPELLERWFTEPEHRRPPALLRWDELADRFGRGRPAVFLDYDGTLTPIVDRPDQAVLSDATRQVVAELSRRFPTTIVSGRGREDVERLVGLETLHYAGSHGFDISGPGNDGEERIEHQVAAGTEPIVEEVSRGLKAALDTIEGTVVEPKRFTVAVHYRMVSEADRPRVERAVDEALQKHPELRKAHGKKVFELRPAFDWDKGKAILWLLEALDLDHPDVVPLYLGDDTTDEDAFRALRNRGVGIVVTRAPRPTAADYQLQDPLEVREFLERLARI
jgi:trehalose-phosphatase